MMIVTNKNAFALYMDARFEYGIALDQLENLSNAMAAYKLTISMDD